MNVSKESSFFINFGPQHPASHGVLRMLLQMSGEVIHKADIHIGFLHRSSEYLISKTTFLKALPFFDRLDYVSMMTQEHAYCLTIEKLLGVNYLSSGLNMLRVLFDELTRLLNHFLAISCHALDIGGMSCIF
jgi:NADH:ubiquinone oxidoreductase subunit D